MTANDIQNIVVTVFFSQLCCDLLANYLIFNGDKYKRLVSAVERAKWKLDKAQADLEKNPNKNAKRFQRAKDDHSTAIAEVAKQHMSPSLWSSIYFFLLIKILGTEHNGKVMALIPFVPYNWVQRITARGLDWSNFNDVSLDTTTLSNGQCVSFLFIYLLSVLSVKFYTHKLVGVQPPSGADGGIFSLLESPQGQRMMKAYGIDPDSLKES